MAGLYAIAAVSESIRGILFEARPQPEFVAADIKILQLSDFRDASVKPVEEGISILLYRTVVSTQQRTLSVRMDAQGNRSAPALPIDLYFLLTVWGKTADKQHRLLGWMMRLLEDTTTIGAGLLNHYGRPDRMFDDSESITLIHDPLSLADMANLWDVLKPNVQLSVGYIARMVYIESLEQPESGERVQTRMYEMANFTPQGGGS